MSIQRSLRARVPKLRNAAFIALVSTIALGFGCSGAVEEEENVGVGSSAVSLQYPAIVAAPNGVGVLPGHGSVTPTGQYHYELPIEVPPGRNGMEPNLSLVYDSSNGDGWLGVGWAISGLSAIRPCAQTVATDGHAVPINMNSSTDGHCWDGRKLVAVGPKGATQEFRTEEDVFAKIVATFSGNQITGYTIQTKAGRILTFTGAFNGITLADTFLITKEADLFGNEMTYSYNVVAPGEYYPDMIQYTGNSVTALAASKRVVFNFQAGGDTKYWWRGGVNFPVNRHLTSIDCISPNPDVVKTVSSYVLGYGTSPKPNNRLLLGSVYRKGAQGGQTLAKKFGWKSTVGPNYKREGAWRFIEPTVARTWGGFEDTTNVVDVNNDGRDDLFREQAGEEWLAYHQATRVYLSQSTNPLTFSNWDPVYLNVNNPDDSEPMRVSPTVRHADLDGTGHLTILDIGPFNVNGAGGHSNNNYLTTREWDKYHNDFSNLPFFPQDLGPFIPDPATPVHRPLWNSKLFVADINGDGLKDLVIGKQDPASQTGSWCGPHDDLAYTWSVRLNTGVPAVVNGVLTVFAAEQIVASTEVNGAGKETTFYAPMFQPKSDWMQSSGVAPGAIRRNGSLAEELIFAGKFTCEPTTDVVHRPGEVDPLSGNPLPFVGVTADSAGVPKRTALQPGAANGTLLLADVNGDGAQDSLMVYPSGLVCVSEWGGGTLGLFGGCVGPSTNLPAAFFGPYAAFHSLAFDSDGDGRDELVLVKHDTGQSGNPILGGYKIWLGMDGLLQSSPISLPSAGGPTAAMPFAIGDFNGDGMQDVIAFDDVSPDVTCQDPLDPTCPYSGTQTSIYTAQAATKDLLVSVSEAGAVREEEGIQYSNQWWPSIGSIGGDPNFWPQFWAPNLNDPALTKPTRPECQYPQRCGRKGMNVVVSHNIDLGEDVQGPLHTVYAYADPRWDGRGRGFLGFGAVDAYTWETAHEVTTYYDLSAVEDTKKVTKSAFRPTDVWDRTMIVQEDAAGNIAPPSHGLSRVAHTSTSYIFSSLNGGANYAIFPYDRTTEEWDEDLTLAANATPALSHGGQMSMGPPNNATKLTRSEHFAFDSFGNLIDHTARTRGVNCVGDEDEETAVWTYPPDITNWLVGLPQTVKTWKSPHGMPLPAPRVVDYTYAPGASTPASFFVATETVEAGSIPGPGGTNPVPVQTTYVPTSEGLVDTVRVKEFTGEPARTTRYTYDSISHSFVATKINALAQTETYLTEPGFGVVVSSSDINGAATGAHTDIVLDDLGRPRQITRTGGITTTIAYSARLKAGADGIVTTIANSDGSTTITEADFGGRPKKESTVGFDGTLISRDSAYDLHGQLVTVSKPYQGAGPGIASAHGQTWDTLGRVVSEVEGKYTTQYLYDSVLSTRVVDPGLHTRVLNKSCDGRIASSIQKQTAPLPDVTTSYYYGNFDELTSVSDTKNNISKFGYDQRGRRISFVDGDSGVTGTAYNGFGDVTSTIAGGVLSGTVVTGGTATQYTHDVLGRVLTRSTPTDGLTKYQWDTSGLWGKGNIAYTISGAGLGAVRHDYAYDLLARPAGESWTIGGAAPLSTQQSYDNLGRLSIVTYPQAAGHSTFSTIQAYNAYGYPASIQGPCSGFICIRPIYWSTTTMDWDGHIVAGKYGNGITASRSWVNQELTAIHDGVITSLGYTYDADGLVLDRTDFAANRKETHHYDDLHRLHTYDLAYGSTANEKFDYDDLGNLTKWTRTGAGPKAVNYAYLDPNGKHRLTSATGSETYALGYDGGVAANRGRVTGDTQRTYTYTEFDLPRTIVQPSPIGGGNITTTFDYDGDNQRVRKSSSLGTTITLGGLFEKRTTPAGTVTDVYYIPGPEGVVAQLTVDETTQAETLEYLHHDNLGSVVAITNSAGALVSRLFYTPFGARADIGGNPISSAGGDVRLGLAELSFDDDLGLIDQRGRIYNPRSRHFLTADPHVTSPLNSQSWNSYSYVVNNPVNLVDPTGFDCAETGPGQVACTPVTITPERPENPASLAGETLGSRGGDWTESRPLVMRDDGLPGSAPDRDYVEERRQQVRGQAAQLISLLGGISAAPSPAERAANRDAMEAAAAGDFQPLTEVILGPPPKTIGEQIDRLVHPLDYPQLPAYQPGDRTRGWLKTGNGIYELHSGESGGPPAIPLPGRNSTNFTHVEAHAAQIMRVEGVMEATLEINRIPCGVGPGCANNLPHMLPEGATLRVVGPGGYDRTFIGLPDPARYPRK